MANTRGQKRIRDFLIDEESSLIENDENTENSATTGNIKSHQSTFRMS